MMLAQFRPYVNAPRTVQRHQALCPSSFSRAETFIRLKMVKFCRLSKQPATCPLQRRQRLAGCEGIVALLTGEPKHARAWGVRDIFYVHITQAHIAGALIKAAGCRKDA